jgi:hypothetical protein
VLGELVNVHLGQRIDQVFPGYESRKRLGVLSTST